MGVCSPLMIFSFIAHRIHAAPMRNMGSHHRLEKPAVASNSLMQRYADHDYVLDF